MPNLIPAARYIRMSTEHQRYSPTIQAAAITRFADERGFEIVADYQDHGKSGLTLRGRDGLKQLLADVLEGRASFRAVLVLDVSRWGRFQDPDQAAHYEFLCRDAGIQVYYCCEPFVGDTGPSSSIYKQIKRVMAAEYSRELGVKSLQGAIAASKRGFKQGGPAPYGLRRVLVNRFGQQEKVLDYGDRCAKNDEHVIYIPGPVKEQKVVRKIFSMYVDDDQNASNIAKVLRSRGVKDEAQFPFSKYKVLRVLKNELYTGLYSYNKRSGRLHAASMSNAQDMWVRVRMFRPIISAKCFALAQEKMQARRPRELRVRKHFDYTPEHLKSHLLRILEDNGKITSELIEKTPGPRPHHYYKYFHDLGGAYDSINYRHPGRRPIPRATISNTVLVGQLRTLLRQHGHLSARLIESDPTLPSSVTFQKRFGSLANAYEAAGWTARAAPLNVLGTLRRRQALQEMEAARGRERAIKP